ncbi:MAG: exodeoxyribonuclease VII small subunit [Clostridium sp.]|nr:exodeoxyribonuclease VII small subunit [Clostridium sp.]
MAEQLTIEQIFAELDRIVRTMDDGEVSLEDSFTLYETGMKLVKEAGERIDLVEKKIRVLQENGPDGEKELS